jgi:uncharacterized protein GlcG (DUF336 family)
LGTAASSRKSSRPKAGQISWQEKQALIAVTTQLVQTSNVTAEMRRRVKQIQPRKETLMRTVLCAVGGAMLASAALADSPPASNSCSIPANTVNSLQSKLARVVTLSDGNGGLFKPNRMWSAVVDRQGTLCSIIVTGDAWPGSRAIAIAKAETANDFSNSALALSTTNLYAPTQPGGSLYGLNNSNPFNPFYNRIFPNNSVGLDPGGIITFGGGVALYSNGQVIGGLGVSGDSSCADHAIAFRMRKLASLDHIPSGVAPDNTDNIIYAPIGSATTGFQQPHCFPQDLTPAQVETIP